MKCSVCNKNGHNKRFHKNSGGSTLSNTLNVLGQIGKSRRQGRAIGTGIVMVGVLIGGTVYLGVKGTQKGIEISKDVYNNLEQYFKENRNKDIKRIEDFTLEEIEEIETIKDQLSLVDFAKVESRKRKLINELMKKKKNNNKLKYMDDINYDMDN